MANVTINSLTAKTTPVDADVTILIDSAASNDNKKVTFANIYNYIKAKTDIIYQATLVSGTNIKTINSTSLLGSGDITITGGTGDVSKVGTPVNNQVGVWTGDGTIEGDTSLTFDTATDLLTVAGKVATPEVKATSSAGVSITNSSGTAVMDLGTGGTTNSSVHGSINVGVDSTDYIQFVGGTGTTTENIVGASTNIDKVIVPKGSGRFQVTGGAYVSTSLDVGHTSDTTITRASAGQLAVEGVNVLMNGGALGTPSSGTVTNLTGTASININGTVGATTPTTASVTTLTTSGNIELGNASDTTLSRAAAGDIAVEGVSVLTTSNTKTVSGKRQQPRTASSTTSSNLSPDLSTANVYFRTTQTATLTIDAPTGTPVIGETIMIYVDSAGAQTLTINSTYKAFGAAFPATTTAGKTFMMSAQYNGTDWKTLWANLV